eukprot:12248184-Ditylum_brightwellii.AAC.1
MDYPMQIEKDCFEKLDIDGCPVEVQPSFTARVVQELGDALNQFDPSYDDKICSKHQLRKMSLIHDF